MPRLYNHRGKIKGRVALKEKQVMPGTIIEFTYAVSDITDRKPILLVLANGMFERKVNSKHNVLLHGINLNYLSNNNMRRLFQVIAERPIRGEDLDMVDKDRDVRGRFIPMNQRYTRLSLPIKEGSVNTSNLRPIIISMYGYIAGQILNKADAYRKYIWKDVGGIRGLRFDVPGAAR